MSKLKDAIDKYFKAPEYDTWYLTEHDGHLLLTGGEDITGIEGGTVVATISNTKLFRLIKRHGNRP